MAPGPEFIKTECEISISELESVKPRLGSTKAVLGSLVLGLGSLVPKPGFFEAAA